MNKGAKIALRPEQLGSGKAATLLANGFNMNSLRVHSLLQKDEWVDLDTTVVQVARKQLNGIADLQARGLTYNLGGLGVLTSEWENTSSMTDANVDMSGVAPGQEDTVEFTLQGVPVPVIHKDYRLNIRRLEASRRAGSSLDTVQAAEASRRVSLKLEDILFNGHTIKSDGYSIYGYTTFPSRLRANIANAWDGGSADMVSDVIHMIELAQQSSFYGPFMLYVPTNYWPSLMEDYDTYKDGTWMDRLLMIPQLEDIKVTSALGSKEVVMVQMTPNVVDLAIGQDITNVPWDEQGGMIQHMKVMGAMVPRLKTTEDEDGNTVCGIIHAFESGTSTTTTA